MDKTQLIQELVAQLLEHAEMSSRSSKAARQASIEAPSKMESRYDSTKSEQDWLSHALALSSAQTRRGIEQLQAVDLTPSKNTRVGSIVVAKNDEKGDVERYFILPAGSGMVLQKGTPQQIAVVTANSPVGVAFMGKVQGDRCEVKTPKGVRALTIVSLE